MSDWANKFVLSITVSSGEICYTEQVERRKGMAHQG
jgi:hypothetical protein